MVNSIFFLIVKAHPDGAFLVAAFKWPYAILVSQAFTNLSDIGQRQAKFPQEWFAGFTAGGAPVNSGHHEKATHSGEVDACSSR
jgi:hypothetical protein